MVRYSALKGMYEIEKTIGCGGFAKVKLATHIATGEKVAVKIMEKTALGGRFEADLNGAIAKDNTKEPRFLKIIPFDADLQCKRTDSYSADSADISGSFKWPKLQWVNLSLISNFSQSESSKLCPILYNTEWLKWKKDDLPRVKTELKALMNLSHQHICKLYQVIETDTHFFLVMEYCSGGELFDHIVEKNRLSESESRMFFRQILSAVAYLHSLGYAHRDLKPENVLLDHTQTLKLIDFGLCARPEGGVQSPLYTSCGSPTYAAPELVLGKKYLGPEVDVWAMGVLLYALLAGCLPFDDSSVDMLYKKILSGKYEEPSFLSPLSKSLIRSMLQVSPSSRITISALLCHPWLTMGVLEPVDFTPREDKLRDDDCVELLAKHRGISPDEMWKRLKKWNYDYDTATYMLMMARKNKCGGVKLNGRMKKELSAPKSDILKPLDLNIPKLCSPSKTSSKSTSKSTPKPSSKPSPLLTPKSLDKPGYDAVTPTKSLGITKEDCVTPKNNMMSPGGEFVEPRRPSSIRKPMKRIRSPNLDGECSPVPSKQKLVNGPVTPSSEKKQRSGTTTPSATPGSAKKVLLDSIERGLTRVRHVLTPSRNKPDNENCDQPQTLSNKGLCNVSTTQCSDPELVITELAKALGKRGIVCRRKGFILRGKTPPSSLGTGCSFELEVCYLPRMGLAPGGRVAVRRKRLEGNSWCYKRVCEQVLALAAGGFTPIMGIGGNKSVFSPIPTESQV